MTASDLVRTYSFQDPPEDPEELCEWWIEFGAPLNAKLWDAKRRVESYVRDRTVVETSRGTLEAQSAGWDWDEQSIAVGFPELVSEAWVRFSGAQKDVERALSIITEDVPALSFEVGQSIDKRTALKRANAGGTVGERLRELRTAKPAKVVIR